MVHQILRKSGTECCKILEFGGQESPISVKMVTLGPQYWGPKFRFTAVTLTLYEQTQRKRFLHADASSHSLRAVLKQKADGIWKPIVCAYRSKAETEKHYAQMEKEDLATTGHTRNYLHSS